MGDGINIQIGRDLWVIGNEDGLISTVLPSSISYSLVASLIDARSRNWNGDIINNIFNSSDASLIQCIPLSFRSVDDE